MIAQKYIMRCDAVAHRHPYTCGKSFPESDTYYIEKEMVRDAEHFGWKEVDGNHYCPEHAKSIPSRKDS